MRRFRLFLFLLLPCLFAAPGVHARPVTGDQPDGTSQVDLSTIDLSCSRCNIILLNIELLRADYVGLINDSQPSDTPNIDRFFSRSLVFQDVAAPAGESYRSNLSVQTAMHGFHYRALETEIDDFIGKWNRSNYSEADNRIAKMLTRFPAMAEYFQKHGFHTVSMNQGIRAGRYLLLDRGFDEVVNWSRERVSFITTVDEFVAKLGGQKKQQFLIHYRPEVLHPFPYYYPDSRPLISSPGEIYNHHRPQFSRYNIRFRPSLTPPKKREVHHRIYRQQVHYVDDELDRVFSAIEDEGLDKSSIIVLYANHGSGLGDNGVDKLAVSYQSCIHVPLLIRHPKLDRAIRITSPVPLIDLVPTLLDMAGLPVPEHFDGETLLRDLTERDPLHPYLIGRNDYDEYIRKNDLKLIIKNGELLELYDLEKDPSETGNLSHQLAAETRALRSALDMIKLSILEKDGPAVDSRE